MTLFTTAIESINPQTGNLTSFRGPIIKAISFADAQNYCDNNGLGYCRIDGILIEEISVINDKPDFENKIDYQTPKLN